METKPAIRFFEKFLTIWVVLCMGAGILIAKFIPALPDYLSRLQFAQVNFPITFLIWLMIFPMMLKVDFSSIVHHVKKPKGLALTLVVNWLIKPFTMYLIAVFFFKFVFRTMINTETANQYLAGAVLLGAAPCTAMVFVWSSLTKGDPAYTVLQVAVNDLVILFAFTPIVALLLGISGFIVPFATLLTSVVLFVVVPLTAGFFVRKTVLAKKGIKWFEEKLLKPLAPWTIIGLLCTLIIIFSFQGTKILEQPAEILLISIPLVLQTILIFVIGYLGAKILKLSHDIAAPAALIGASNFFELAVAVAISLFGIQSGAALATVVGVLVEVPVMLALVTLANKTGKFFRQQK